MRKKQMIAWGSILFIVCSICIAFLMWRSESREYKITYDVVGEKEAVSSLRVGTYNVKLLDEGTALSKFISDIEGLNLDVIALQEVDKLASRSNNMDMVKEMAEKTDYPYYHFFESMYVFDGYYGLGILSKYPIVEVESKELPTGLLSEPRILSKTKIQVGSEEITFYNTHLTYFNRGTRNNQLDVIKEELKGKENTILLGDLNNFSKDDLFTLNGYKSANNKERQYITFHESGFTENVYYSDNLYSEEFYVQKTSFSDHHLLWTTFHLNNGGNKYE